MYYHETKVPECCTNNKNRDILQKTFKYYFYVFLICVSFSFWCRISSAFLKSQGSENNVLYYLGDLHPRKKQSTYLICGFLLGSYPKYHTMSSIFHSPNFTEPCKHEI